MLYDIVDGFFDGVRRTNVLSTALNLGLFQYTISPMSVEALSRELDVDVGMFSTVCNILVSMGLLEKNYGGYVNTAASDLYLVRESPYCMITTIRNRIDHVSKWKRLEEALHKGGIETDDPFFTEDWISGIGESSKGGPIAETVSTVESSIDMSEIGSFLDMGGGHGLYAVGFKHRHPRMKCSLFDQECIVPVAEKNFKEYGVDIDIQKGNFYKDPVKGRFDVVFSSYNRSGMDPKMAPIVLDLLNMDGYLIIRKPITSVFKNPVHILEHSIIKRKNPLNSAEPGGFDEYVSYMRKNGVALESREDLNGDTELLIFRRTG